MKTTVRAYNLAKILNDAPAGLRYLSLDCFDTLLWRNVNAPCDVFADLPIAGGAMGPRMNAEESAREMAQFNHRRNEVSIEEIYRRLFPSASPDDIAAAIERELEAEARHCFGFAPTIELMRDAKARGLSIIIVSDTYLNEPQLRNLIGTAAGDEVVALIDRIFCSSEHGRTKGEGLFRPVLEALRVPPSAILHVGDNMHADQAAPSTLGIHTVHLKQFDPACEQRLRLEAAAAAMLDSATRVTIPALQPHRPQLSLRETDDSVWALGHDVMGPLMQAFIQWVRDEAEEMASHLGKPVRPLFLLRDGHLPMQVFKTLFGEDDLGARTVEVSRFTACRASFTGEQAVRDYLATDQKHGRIEVLARQLFLGDSEARRLAGGRSGIAGQIAFSRAVCASAITAKIVARSAEFASRLMAHLESEGVRHGDAVMLVDLGYNGTVQNLIAPVLGERMGLTIAGRYMLLREKEQSGLDKKGFLDPRNYDLNTLRALSGCIAVIEQMCTVTQGSVIDYGADGKPIRKEAGLKGCQNDARDRIQEACLAFVAQADAGVARPARSDDAECRRRMAAAILARLLFLPQAHEVAIFETFDHDVNLGTKDLVKLLDLDESAAGLRRRGLSYLNDVGRMYLPGELQNQGLPLNLSLFAVSRLGLDLRSSDFQTGSIPLSVILADKASQGIVQIDAHQTHDGYYLAAIPVGAARFSVGVQFGSSFEWVQIEEAAFQDVEAFGNPAKNKGPLIPANLIHEGMEEAAPGLFRCGPNALTLVPPPSTTVDKPLVLALAFRPVVRRGEAAEIKRAA